MGDTYSFVMRKKYHTYINTFISVAPQLYIQHKIYSTATWPGGWEIDGPELLNLAANQHSSASFHLAGAVFWVSALSWKAWHSRRRETLRHR